jgi:CheY-like chemotaxis protein
MYENNNTIKPFIAHEARVLIVDDSSVTLKIEEDLMRTYGMYVATAKSGSECINMLISNRYDIIFMDHMMPNMSGIETTLKIRKLNDEYFKNVVIIALTASSSPNVCSLYIKNGFNDFLEKPIDNFKLNKFLRTYLPRKYIVETKIADSPIEEFDEIKIKDVDTKKAIQNCCGSIDNYISLLSVAYLDGINKLKVIKDFANNRDIENYTIEVHALKTVAALIGDTKLFELSKRHEIAGINHDLKFILENVNFLLSAYDNLLNNIKLVLPKEDISINPQIKTFTTDNLCTLLTATANAIDNFDLDSANESLKHLLNYNFTDAQRSTINKVKTFLNIFDYDNAYELINNFKYNLYNNS